MKYTSLQKMVSNDCCTILNIKYSSKELSTATQFGQSQVKQNDFLEIVDLNILFTIIGV